MVPGSNAPKKDDVNNVQFIRNLKKKQIHSDVKSSLKEKYFEHLRPGRAKYSVFMCCKGVVKLGIFQSTYRVY